MVEGARTIKMGGWEPLIEAKIQAARAAEIAMLRRAGALRGLNDGLYFLSPVLVGAAVFVADWAAGRELGPGRVFTTLTLFGILQWNAVYMGGRAIQNLNELWVSVSRLEHLFRMPELPPPPPPTDNKTPAPAIRVQGLSFNYHGSRSLKMPALRNVAFSAPGGGIVGVVGPVGSGALNVMGGRDMACACTYSCCMARLHSMGSTHTHTGKTTLIKALLGELGHAGQSCVLDVGPGPIAYAAQVSVGMNT